MELQAVIFCGGIGNRMLSLCQQNPKCFLPIGGIPMFWFPVNSAIKGGINDILIVFREIHKQKVEEYLSNPAIEIPNHVKIDPFYTEQENEDWGTAEVLRSIIQKGKNIKDLILIAGDFIMDGSLIPMIDMYRAYGADLCCFTSDHCITGPEPGPKMKRSKYRDLIAYEESTNKIVFLASEDDLDQPVDALQWLDKFSKIHITASLNDCHVYIINKKHLKPDIFSQKERKFSSIKADFIPYLIEQQNSESSTSVCILYNQPAENGKFIAHANNIPAYFEINKNIIHVLSRITSKAGSGQHFDFKKTGISTNESRIEKSSQVGFGSVIKRSVIGNHCHLAEKSRIQNSLLMDNVHIGKGANVSNSILCPGTIVEEGAEVSNCLVLNNQRITSGTKVQNEIVEEDDDDDDEDWTQEC